MSLIWIEKKLLSPSRFFFLILIITHDIKLYRKSENLFVFPSRGKILVIPKKYEYDF